MQQHYEAIAAIIQEERIVYGYPQPCRRFATKLADYFAKDNPRFDREKFLEACGL